MPLSAETLFRFATILLLCALAARHLYQNVFDYLFNNVISTYEIKFATDRYPFLPNITLNFRFDLPKRCDYQVILERLNAGDTSEFVQRCTVLMTAGRLSILDINYVDQMHLNKTFQNPELDQVASRPSFAQDMDRRYEELIAMVSITANVTDESISAFGPESLYAMFNVERDYLQNVDQPQLVYCVGEISDFGVYPYEYALFDSGADNAVGLSAGNRFPVSVTLSYESATITDLSGVEGCDPEVISDVMAVWKCEIFEVARRCNCTPSFYRRHFPAANRFCIESIYKECLTAGSMQEVVNECKTAKACVRVFFTGRQMISNTISYCKKFALEIIVQTLTTTYLSIQTQTLTSWTQLLSQIGGNIGLYLGFSFLSLYKVVDCVITVVRDKKGADRKVDLSVHRLVSTANVVVWRPIQSRPDSQPATPPTEVTLV